MGKQQQGVSVEKAAAGLGISKWGAYRAIERGDLATLPGSAPARVSEAEVERFRQARQAAAVERLTAKGTDLVELAQSTRAFLQPYPGTAKRTLSMLGQDVVAVFGAAAVHAASVPAPTCGWCASVVAAQLMHTDPPPYGAAMLALLGPPCARDMQRFAAAEMARLAAQVHPDGVRPAGGRTAGAGAARAGEASVSRPRAAQPVVADDGGKAMVSRRLRAVRGQLKEARRRGDTQHAFVLQRQLQALTADAAVVDGRVTAASRPGTLRCGHALAAGCGCPRRASTRSMS